MVNLTIDRLPVSVKEGTTLMEAAESIGIHIPHLCYWKGLNEIAACRVCVIELEGRDHLITACNLSAQQVIKGTVTDAGNGQPVDATTVLIRKTGRQLPLT